MPRDSSYTYDIDIDAGRLVRRTNVVVRVRRSARSRLRLRLAVALFRLAARVAGFAEVRFEETSPNG